MNNFLTFTYLRRGHERALRKQKARAATKFF